MFGIEKKRKFIPMEAAFNNTPEKEIQTNPFEPNLVEDDFGNVYPQMGLISNGVFIDPRDYGVQDFGYHFIGQRCWRGDIYIGDPEWKSVSADDRVLEFGAKLTPDDLTYLSEATEILQAVRELSQCEDKVGEPEDEATKQLVREAKSRVELIMTGLFAPLLDEQKARRAAIKDSDEQIKERVRQEQADETKRLLAKQAAILTDLRVMLKNE